MLLDDRLEIHPVELVTREDQDEVVRGAAEMDEVAADGIGGALVPVGAGLGLLGREDVHEPAAEGVEVEGALDMPVQRRRVELRQDEDPVDAGVDAVADRDVDEPVLAGERDGRLAALQGERREAGAATAAHDHRENTFLKSHEKRGAAQTILLKP